MKNQLPVILITAFFFLTACREPPKDSGGRLYEFRCEKRPECNNRDGLVQIVYDVKYDARQNPIPDRTKSEETVFCCGPLGETIDSLKKYRDLLSPYNDSLKGRVLTRAEFDTPGVSVLKFIETFYFDEGEDTVCVDLAPLFILSTLMFREMLITVGHKRTGRIFLHFTGLKELDEYIELLEDNYKNCCI